MSKQAPDLIAQALKAHQAGDIATARRLLKKQTSAPGLHLLGLVERKAGNLDKAAYLLAKAAKLEPNHEVRHNQGLVAKAQGKPQDAERFFNAAIKQRPDFAQAWQSLAVLYREQKRWQQAQEAYERAKQLAPDNHTIDLGIALLNLGQGEAKRAISFARAALANRDLKNEERSQARFIRGRALLELGEREDALDDIQQAYSILPSPTILRTLANLLWLEDRQDQLRMTLEEAVFNPAIAASAITIANQQGGAPLYPPQHLLQQADVAAALAWQYIEQQDSEAALSALSAATNGEAEPLFVAAEIVAYTMQGDYAEGSKRVNQQLRVDPNGQHWLGYLATIERLRGNPGLLNDPDVIQIHALKPQGYASVDEFNAQLAQALSDLHEAQVHPLDQTLRNGSQTETNLIHRTEAVIQDYFRALEQPITDYLGYFTDKREHPIARRYQGAFEITDAWSVRLDDAGFHIDHVHPQGWISSAYYVTAEGCEDPISKAGWLRFGIPPYRTPTSLEPLKWVQPEAGKLALFPSYMWHGTVPSASGSVRLTAPFDVSPK